MRRKSKQGQQVVEYLVMVIVVVLVLIAFLRPGGVFSRGINRVLDGALNQINREANEIN